MRYNYVQNHHSYRRLLHHNSRALIRLSQKPPLTTSRPNNVCTPIRALAVARPRSTNLQHPSCQIVRYLSPYRAHAAIQRTGMGVGRNDWDFCSDVSIRPIPTCKLKPPLPDAAHNLLHWRGCEGNSRQWAKLFGTQAFKPRVLSGPKTLYAPGSLTHGKGCPPQ